MPYSPAHPIRTPDPEELRRRIPGWGADLDPAVRPSVPRERLDTSIPAGYLPPQQPSEGYRERSIEHARLTPVFGTAQPLRGPAGAIRRLAYDRFSEGQTVHWLLLVLGDRVDATLSHLRSFASLRPDNPITETGVTAELRYGGVRSRVGRGRVDLKHAWLDPILIAGPFVLAGWVLLRLTRPLRRRR